MEHGRWFFFWDSFDPKGNYDDIKAVIEAGTRHGEESVYLSVLEDGLARLQFNFHGRLEEENYNRKVDGNDIARLTNAFESAPLKGTPFKSEIFGDIAAVTKSEMDRLIRDAGFGGGIGKLIWRAPNGSTYSQ